MFGYQGIDRKPVGTAVSRRRPVRIQSTLARYSVTSMRHVRASTVGVVWQAFGVAPLRRRYGAAGTHCMCWATLRDA